ncbi:leucyl aminopeptidase [Pseudohongiella nitratireducens]|uniref:leucyl aminopeptidase n=1 Tax=Pseudohongiella nitratireducens TaxID=1768907 RepID=UPI0030ECA636|tara:strand:- start:10747 stop:12237 length:1491 start_codon:yes stop_codon:yes gene_type:complete
MKFQLLTEKNRHKKTDCLIVNVLDDGSLADTTLKAVAGIQTVVDKVRKSGDFSGKLAETAVISLTDDLFASRLLLIGGGAPDKFDAKSSIKAIRAAVSALAKTAAKTATVSASGFQPTDREIDWTITRLVQEAGNTAYQYDRTKSKKATPAKLTTVQVMPCDQMPRKAQSAAIDLGEAISLGMSTARELGNLPGNICTPSFLAQTATEMGLKYKSLKVKALTEKQMERLGMGSLLSVGHGSKEESRLIVIEHKGAKSTTEKPYCLVGKGITFDTGGISLKPGAGMDEMKFDMCGAASVIGTMNAVAELNLPINVVAVVAAAENMPGSQATKPGDVVTSMSGKTIEVLNTDAEGRLVLCDALTYAERFKPKSVIDVATLTGAAVATFGNVNTAMLSNNEALAQELFALGQDVRDTVWQLPLDDEYQSLLDSNFADIANIGGPRAGTITAACFLSRFTENFNWAHLDIAGTAWNSGAQKGATGRPVPLLVEYLKRQSN